jgi:nicotinamide N-methyltransferase
MRYVALLTLTECRELTRIGAAEHEALDRDGFLLLRGVFDEERLLSLRSGVDDLIARARAGECRLRWIDEDAGIPDRISHMMHPDKYQPAWGEWISEDVVGHMEALLGGPVRHSLFGMLASGGGRDYRMAWHRDLGKPGAVDELDSLRRHHGQCVQFNAPIAATDAYLHVVPGSHLRPSTTQEIAASRSGVEGEIAAGIEVRLEPGDILYYNANLWHRGWNPEGCWRWTMHAAYWKAGCPVMTHERGQRQAMLSTGHLERLPQRARQLVQRYLDVDAQDPKSLPES